MDNKTGIALRSCRGSDRCGSRWLRSLRLMNTSQRHPVYPNVEELTSSSSSNGAVATGCSSFGASEATTGASLSGLVASSLEVSSVEVGIPSFFLGLKMSPIRAESRR